MYACAMPFFNRMLGMPTDLVISMLLYLLVYPAWEFWTIRQRFAYRYKTMVAATLAVAVLSPVMGVAGIYWLHLQSGAAIFSKLAVQGAFCPWDLPAVLAEKPGLVSQDLLEGSLCLQSDPGALSAVHLHSEPGRPDHD